MEEFIATIQFKPTQQRHAVVGQQTWCFIEINEAATSLIRRRKQDDVTCWQCRKGAHLLRPLDGTCLTIGMPGSKVHRVTQLPGRKAEGMATPCHLDFSGERRAEVRRRSHADVNCGHCMRLSFV